MWFILWISLILIPPNSWAASVAVDYPPGTYEVVAKNIPLTEDNRLFFTATSWTDPKIQIILSGFLSLDNGKTYAAERFCSVTFIGTPKVPTFIVDWPMPGEGDSQRRYKFILEVSGGNFKSNVDFGTKKGGK
jgi:hypothetical protein